MKVKDISPALGQRVREKYKLTDDMPFIRKGLIPEDLRFDEGERSAVDYITTAAVDRDHEIVDPQGGVIEEFMKNPVVLFGHNHYEMPIGKAAWIRSDAKGLIAKTMYANTAKANEVYEYRKAGFPLAKSIGFIPIKTEDFPEGSPERAQGVRRKYTEWLLLEYSDVPVPSNPEALEIAVSKGLIPADIPVELTVEPVEKTEKPEKEVQETDAIEKSGRVLSAKNREIITAAVDAMNMAESALQDLLAATEQAEPEEEPKEEGKASEPEGFIMQESPIYSETDLKNLVKTAVDTAITERIIPALKDVAREAVNVRRGRLN